MAGASGRVAALFFAIYGVLGVIGNLAATRLVGSWGPYATARVFLVIMMAGALSWLFGAGNVVAMGLAMGLWGLGFAAFNSMQQVRLIAAAPELGSASVALNTSAIYVGQGVGSAIGGALYATGGLATIGLVATAFMATALAGLIISRPRGGQSPFAG
jgi:predicted MFS family arabinose efflux permease